MTPIPGQEFWHRNTNRRCTTPRSRAERATIVAFVVTPLAYADYALAGKLLSGWTWLIILTATIPIVLTEPIDRRAARLLMPYALFLLLPIVSLSWASELMSSIETAVQLAIVPVGYLVGWRLKRTWITLEELGRVMVAIVVCATLLSLATTGGSRTISGAGLSVRYAGMSLVVVIILLGVSASWRLTVLAGIIALSVTMATGSRMASAVLVLVLISTPSIVENRRRWLAVVVACAVGTTLLTSTAAFRERFFFSDDATLRDLFVMSNEVNTAGRTRVWPELVDGCAQESLLGGGVGNASELTYRLSFHQLTHPHNEYLRIYCDHGYVGSILFWGFFFAAACRAAVGAKYSRHTRIHGAALQLVFAFALFSFTDNPLLYTTVMMFPLSFVLGVSDSVRLRTMGPRRPMVVSKET